MKKSELKRIIRPMVKECVQETLLESGLLSNIVAEVAKGLGGQVITEETRAPAPAPRTRDVENIRLKESKRQRKELLDAIGKDAYNGVDLFEGTSPIRDNGAPSPSAQASPMHGQDPNDAGVDISGILSLGGKNWKALVG
tara:strand:+ start:733 stop:1152 length:420 start_codon:yes stop_codon:yes gene_type:complete